MEIIERISEIISSTKKSARAFALKCNIKPQTLSSQLTHTRELGLSTVIAILTTFEDISAEWLLRGEGSMLKSEAPTPHETDNDFDRLMKLVDTITTLQDVVNEKSKTIAVLTERIKQLEAQRR